MANGNRGEVWRDCSGDGSHDRFGEKKTVAPSTLQDPLFLIRNVYEIFIELLWCADSLYRDPLLLFLAVLLCLLFGFDRRDSLRTARPATFFFLLLANTVENENKKFLPGNGIDHVKICVRKVKLVPTSSSSTWALRVRHYNIKRMANHCHQHRVLHTRWGNDGDRKRIGKVSSCCRGSFDEVDDTYDSMMSPSGLKGETAVIPPTRLEVSGRIGHFHIEVARPRLSTVSSKKKKDETLCRTDCRED